jgi:hypothetical protein
MAENDDLDRVWAVIYDMRGFTSNSDRRADIARSPRDAIVTLHFCFMDERLPRKANSTKPSPLANKQKFKG